MKLCDTSSLSYFVIYLIKIDKYKVYFQLRVIFMILFLFFCYWKLPKVTVCLLSPAYNMYNITMFMCIENDGTTIYILCNLWKKQNHLIILFVIHAQQVYPKQTHVLFDSQSVMVPIMKSIFRKTKIQKRGSRFYFL